jgi:hypothetical protein
METQTPQRLGAGAGSAFGAVKGRRVSIGVSVALNLHPVHPSEVHEPPYSMRAPIQDESTVCGFGGGLGGLASPYTTCAYYD